MELIYEIRKFKTLIFNVSCRHIEINDKILQLSSSEFNIFDLLSRRPGMVFNRQQIMDAIYGENAGYYDQRTCDSHIKRMRKLGVTGIITHYCTGYAWEDRVVKIKGKSGFGIRQREVVKEVKTNCDYCGAPLD